MSRGSREMPPIPEKPTTHQQQAMEHQNFFLDNKKHSLKNLNERPHDIVIGVEGSKCRTCGERWPKPEPKEEKEEE